MSGAKAAFAKQAIARAPLQPASAHVLFSSIAALFGSPGQANYACANAALDTIGTHSASLGLPTCSIQWGPWAGSGMAAAQQGTPARLATLGLGLIEPLVGLRALQQSLITTPTLSGCMGGSTLTVVVAEWSRLASHSSHSSQLLTELVAQYSSAAIFEATMLPTDLDASCQQSEVSDSCVGQARSAAMAGRAQGQKLEDIRETVASVIASIMGQEVSQEQPLMAAGLDSLGAVELRKSLQQRLSVDLPATLIFDYPIPKALAGYIAQLLLPTQQLQGATSEDLMALGTHLGAESMTVSSHVGRPLKPSSQSLSHLQVVMATGFAGMSPGVPDAAPASGDCVGLIPYCR